MQTAMWTPVYYERGTPRNVPTTLRDAFFSREWEVVGKWWLVPQSNAGSFVDFGDLFVLSDDGTKRIVLSRRHDP
jgi:hypothetical protein